MNYNYEPKRRKTTYWWLFLIVFLAFTFRTAFGSYIKNIVVGFLSSLTPIIIGISIAFLLKRVIDFLENKILYKIFSKCKYKKQISRTLSLIIIFTILIAFILLIISSFVPKIINIVSTVNTNLNEYLQNLNDQLVIFFEDLGWFKDVDIQQTITNVINNIIQTLSVNVPIIATNIVNLFSSTITFTLYLIIGIILSVMMLKDKEKINKYFYKLNYSFNKKERADKIMHIAKTSDNILLNFISIKFLETLIVFIMCLPGFYWFEISNPIILCIIFAFLNIIPYIGQFFAIILITVVNLFFGGLFINSIWLFIYINVVLTIEGYVLMPIIVGKKLKTHPVATLVSSVLFGGLFGIWGMLLGPAIIAVIAVFIDEYLEQKNNSQLNNVDENNNQEKDENRNLEDVS